MHSNSHHTLIYSEYLRCGTRMIGLMLCKQKYNTAPLLDYYVYLTLISDISQTELHFTETHEEQRHSHFNLQNQQNKKLPSVPSQKSMKLSTDAKMD